MKRVNDVPNSYATGAQGTSSSFSFQTFYTTRTIRDEVSALEPEQDARAPPKELAKSDDELIDSSRMESIRFVTRVQDEDDMLTSDFSEKIEPVETSQSRLQDIVSSLRTQHEEARESLRREDMLQAEMQKTKHVKENCIDVPANVSSLAFPLQSLTHIGRPSMLGPFEKAIVYAEADVQDISEQDWKKLIARKVVWLAKHSSELKGPQMRRVRLCDSGSGMHGEGPCKEDGEKSKE
jgi:hypothetical protein